MKSSTIKIGSVLVILLLAMFFVLKNNDGNFYNNIRFDEHSIYIFFRETNSKVGRIATSYNVNNTNYSHVGIGAIINNKLRIVHILPADIRSEKNNQTDLLVETINQFYNPKSDSVISAEILRCQNISPRHFKNFLNVVSKLKSEKLVFDKNFSTQQDSAYYCSELVAFILESTDKKFAMIPVKKKLNGFDELYLQKDSLNYFPVDIFINSKNFLPVVKKLQKEREKACYN